MKKELESKKVWHYKHYEHGAEYYAIARTKEEAIKKITKKGGKPPVEIWWKTLYNPKETTYPKGTIF